MVWMGLDSHGALQARVSEWLGEAYEALKASGVASSGRPQPGAPHADEGDSDAESSLDGSAASDGNPSGPISRGWSSEQQVGVSSCRLLCLGLGSDVFTWSRQWCFRQAHVVKLSTRV